MTHREVDHQRDRVTFPFTFACALWIHSREACNEGEGDPPLYVNVNMFSGQLMNTWIDSLQAFFPGLQVSGRLVLRRAGETAQWVRVLLCEPAGLSLNLQHSPKRTVVAAWPCHSRAGGEG